MTSFPLNAEFVRRCWREANASDKNANKARWLVALPAMRAVGKRNGETQELANAIYAANTSEVPLEDRLDAPTDTVERLARAGRYFYALAALDCRRAMNLRRRFGYARFAMLWNLYEKYEFDLADKGFDYLEMNLSNSALRKFLEDAEESRPEWERRSLSIYESAAKLVDDLDVPEGLRSAAKVFVKEYRKVFNVNS